MRPIRYKYTCNWPETLYFFGPDPALQVDLLFDRDDNVITFCEIKYLQGKVPKSVIEEMEKKLLLFPNKKNKAIHKVLICVNGVETHITDVGYFDRIITLDELFDAHFY